jgi:hypothetical protein
VRFSVHRTRSAASAGSGPTPGSGTSHPSTGPRPTWRAQVETNDVGDLLGKRWIFADLERARPVWLQSVLVPQRRHVTVRYVHARGSLDERRHLPARPMRQPSISPWTRSSRRQDSRPNRCRNLLTTCGMGFGQSSQRVLRPDSGSTTDQPLDARPPPTRRPAFSIGLPSTTTRSAPVSPPTLERPHFSPQPATWPAGLSSAPPTYLTLRPTKTA